jgi:1-deoxy-D-xylulose-5-phosphate synthase
MLRSALDYGHPVSVRFPKGKVRGVPIDKERGKIPLGKAELLKEGEHLLLAFGNMVHPALEAAERLEKDGISLAVGNARFAKPLDGEMILGYARPGSFMFTAEEGVIDGGFGSAVREFLDSRNLFDLRFKRIGLPVEIYPVGKVEEIKARYRLDVPGLIAQIQEFFEANGG